MKDKLRANTWEYEYAKTNDSSKQLRLETVEPTEK